MALTIENGDKGRFIKVDNYDAYFVEASPENAHKDSAVLYVSDVIGIWEESKQRADKFAARGYTTLMIDLFNGDRVKKGDFESLDKNSWLANGRNGRGPHTPKEVDPIVQRGVSYLRKDLGFKHVGAAGYSFGARFLVRNLNAGIDAGYIAYPSFVKDDELAAITAPLSIAASETDTILTNEDRHRWEEILKENGNLYQINLYSGVVHGFYAAERDVDKVHEKFAQEHSFLQAVTFFDRWLA